LNRKIQLATHRQHFSSDPEDVKRALQEEAGWLNEITRLMDRMRAVEGHLLRARGKLKPVVH
jgi:hypothetical protein